MARRVVATTDLFGVATAQMATSTEPPLGTWQIEASFVETTGGGTDAYAVTANPLPFTMEKYVLPTFEVDVVLDSDSVFRGIDKVDGTVKATYTHGPRVGGEVALSVWQKRSRGFGGGFGVGVIGGGMMGRMAMPEMKMAAPDQGSGTSSSTNSEYTLLKEIPPFVLSQGGVTDFSVDLSDANVDYGWGGWGQLGGPAILVEASVKSAATGETQNGTATALPRFRTYDVHITCPSVFKPGTQSECLFNAESFSDARVTGTFSVSSKFYKKNGDTVSGANSPIAITLTSSDQGQKKFYVTIPTDTPSCCLVSDAYQWRSGSCCLSSGEVVFDSSAAGAKNAASALNAAAAVLPDAVPSASHWGSIATPSGVINAHVTIHGVPLERVGVGVSISATVRSSFDPPGGFFDYAVLSNGVGVLVSGQVARDGLVTFTTTNTMQSAQLVVYVGNDGNGGESVNVVACAKPIGVTTTAANNQRCLPQNVTLSLDVLETTPGSGVSLTATTTAPGSRVYLLAHDVSVILQSKGTQSAMSASKVLQAAAATLGVSETDGDTTFDPMSQMSGGVQCYPPADIDATQVLLVTAMKTNTCVPNGFGGMIEDEMMMAMPLAAPEMAFKSNVAETDTAGASALSADADDSDSSPTETIQTRRFFPETWVWRSVDTDNSTGIGQLDDLRAPDTITRWRFRAFSSHPSLGIGT